eukprot:TRINITY_DN27764_c0_g1_i1.p1 TRINITY_DN27764_c0_g1~~TRINITY_DN27764_c0_g1_i1.p1  ORF type:complete len:412 (+),score=70.53 TRINITY_DN27764_c0_g1_i1:147-1382(+)
MGTASRLLAILAGLPRSARGAETFEYEIMSDQELEYCLNAQSLVSNLFETDASRVCAQGHLDRPLPVPVCEVRQADDTHTAVKTAEAASMAVLHCIADSMQTLNVAWRLNYFVAHMSRAALWATSSVMVSMQNRLSGTMPGGRLPLDDMRNGTRCSLTYRITRQLHNMYREQGVEISYAHLVTSTTLPSARIVQPTQQAFHLHGCHKKGDSNKPPLFACFCLQPGKKFSTGWGLLDGDIEVFVHLALELPRSSQVFIIGNAFGFSTLLLAKLFPQGAVDAIDAETELECAPAGSWLTRRMAAAAGLNVQLTAGTSPGDVPKAMRAPQYDLAFIDGYHSNEQLLLDFHAVEPYMLDKSVIVLHDVGFMAMEKGLSQIPRTWQRYWTRGRRYKNMAGTVILSRGYPEGHFDSY